VHGADVADRGAWDRHQREPDPQEVLGDDVQARVRQEVVDVGHPDEPGLRRALEELAFFTTDVKILGVYPADAFRTA
jgi:hypothetical protein